jgi:hypothetical protein
VNLAAPQCILERLLIHAEVIAGSGLDVTVAGEFFNEHDVGTVMEQAGTKCVAEQVRRELLEDATSLPQPPEHF